jgi:UDP-N-acetylmuramoyl-tripeptide--D-alanyl-D-alanine ligase
LRKKENENLIKIGITGSYGKTSTKYILGTILKEKYNVLFTPGSYNTTMGNVKVIREQLKPEHEVFISEMGARKKHDIREICDFVHPDIGIITSIGEQHLETFKTIENVAKTKAEMLGGTRFDGAIFLPKDDERCFELYKDDKRENKFIYSLKDIESDVYASDIKTSKDGSEFIVHSKKYGTYNCKTILLGMHNVQNILCAITVAEYLDLSKEQIIEGIKKLEPVEHRLQLLPSTNGTIVIDDAFNSNPVGSKYALDVLGTFDGRKIIITPGMVELGKEEYNLNKEFGKYMAKVADIAILIGYNRAKPIEEGLKEENFNDMNIYVVSSLNEATERLSKLTKTGDVIMFENDLPDAYNE